MAVLEILLLLAIVLFNAASFLYYKKKFKFWKKLGVPFLKPIFIFGNIFDVVLLRKHFGYVMQSIYQQLKNGKHDGYCGMYFASEPVMLVLTPEFAKTVLATDFQYFTDRGLYSNPKIDPMSSNLFFLKGSKWRHLRAKLTPTFTSAKLKMMTATIVAVGDELNNYLTPFADKNEDIDVRETLSRFMTDIIGSCAYGIDCNSLKNPNSQFRKMGKQMISFSKLHLLKIYLATMFPNAARKLNVRFNAVAVTTFFTDIVKETIDQRERDQVRRKDFMQILLDLKEKGELESDTDDSLEVLDEKKTRGNSVGLTFKDIAAQAFVFFFAGFETSSTAMTYALHLLARHPEIQEKGRQEIRQVIKKYGGKLTFEGVMELRYTENIISETLRVCPPVATLHRKTDKAYQLPNGNTLPVGTTVVIPLLAFQRDPEFYPNPMEFDPNRFNDDEKAKRHPFCYLPFGEGPRYCIGQRFGLLQIKLGLAMLLNSFEFSVCEKTEIPLKIDIVNLMHTTKGAVYLKIKKC